MASWDDPRAVQAAHQGPREQLFLSLKEDLRIRVIGAPEFFERHWVMSRTGKYVGIRCPGSSHCPVCAMGDKPRLRAILPVLDRKTNKVKLLDAPQIIIGYLKALKDGEWGDLSGYDVVIQRVQVGKKTDYQVTPQPSRTPLTEADKAEINRFFETVDYKKYAQPHTIEEALALLNGQQLPSKRPETISYTGEPARMQTAYTNAYAPQAPAPAYIPPNYSQSQTVATPTAPQMQALAPQTGTPISSGTPTIPNTQPGTNAQPSYVPPASANTANTTSTVTDQLIQQFLPQGYPSSPPIPPSLSSPPNSGLR
jgi:hypothetical protein